MKKFRKILSFIPLFSIFLLAFALSGCTQTNQQDTMGKIKVVATFYPLYDFAKNIGGERVYVTSLIPSGVEPHEFEPSPSTIKQLNSANVLIYNGAGLEPWLPKLLEGIDNKNLISADTSKGIQLISTPNPAKGGEDPHIWLDPVLAKKQVENIRDTLIQADPEGRSYYENNTNIYLEKLDELDSELRNTMKTCKKRDILITHATLGYFCKEYNCTQIPIEGINPEAEPSPADIVKIIEQAKERNITAVFFESLINPKSAQTIAQEIKGTVASFNSVHGLTEEEQKQGKDYLSLMRENIANIKEALQCE